MPLARVQEMVRRPSLCDCPGRGMPSPCRLEAKGLTLKQNPVKEMTVFNTTDYNTVVFLCLYITACHACLECFVVSSH